MGFYNSVLYTIRIVYFLVFNLFFFSAYYDAMGLISPKKNEVSSLKKVDRHYLDAALMEIGNSPLKDGEGTVRTYSQRLALSIWNDALFSETVKDRAIMAKLILERVGGKPAVIADDEKEELPEVVFRVNANDAKKIKALQDLPVEEEPQDKVVVEIDGEPKMEF